MTIASSGLGMGPKGVPKPGQSRVTTEYAKGLHVPSSGTSRSRRRRRRARDRGRSRPEPGAGNRDLRAGGRLERGGSWTDRAALLRGRRPTRRSDPDRARRLHRRCHRRGGASDARDAARSPRPAARSITTSYRDPRSYPAAIAWSSRGAFTLTGSASNRVCATIAAAPGAAAGAAVTACLTLRPE